MEEFPVPIPPREEQDGLVNPVNEIIKAHQDALIVRNNFRLFQRSIINQVF